jgi:hypothetical protein
MSTPEQPFTPGSWADVTEFTGWAPGKSPAGAVKPKPRALTPDESFLQECIRKYDEFKRIGERAKKDNYRKFGGFDR